MLHPAIILHLHLASAGLEQRANVGQSTDCWGEPILIIVTTLGTKKPFMFVFDLKGKYTPDTIYMECSAGLLHRSAKL